MYSYSAARPALVALLISAFMLFTGCASVKSLVDMQKPDAKVSGVSLSSLSLTDVTLLVDVDVSNPNAIELKAADFDLALSIDGQKLAAISEPDMGIAIPANGMKTVQFPLTFTFKEVAAAVGGLKGKNVLDYSVDGKVKVDVPILGQVSMPVSFNDVLPVPKLPVIRFKGVKLDSIDWSGAEMTLDLDVTNPNMFGVDLNSLTFQLNADGRELSKGSLSQVNLSEGETESIKVPVSFSLTSMGISLFRLLSSGDSINVNLTGVADILPDLGIWKPEPLTFDASQQLNP